MSVPVQEGQVLDDKYVVEQLLGAGGMGVVVRAHHIHLDEAVAIKFLVPEAMKVPEAVARSRKWVGSRPAPSAPSGKT